MKRMRYLAVGAVAVFGLALWLGAQDVAALPAGGWGFVDADGDGINDRAPDADGDGIPNGQDEDYTGSRRGRGAAR